VKITAGLVLVIAACGSSAPATRGGDVAGVKSTPGDASLFPASWPTLRAAETATDPAKVAQLVGTALGQLAEERELSTKDDAHERAYERLVLRLRIVQDHAWMSSGKSIEALADVAKQPFECPAVPERTRHACESLLAGLATAFPNVISGPGRVAQVDQSLVVDDAMTPPALQAFLNKAAGFQGSVVQRMRVTSATGGTIKIGPLVVATASKQRLGGGDLVWVAFEPRLIRQVGKTWDLANARVLFVETPK
jgi:hypothetical protein